MTIAQQLNVKNFPFSIKNNAGQEIYVEIYNGYWVKKEYNDRGESIRYEDSTGCWLKRERDAAGNITHYEDSNGYWYKREYDANGIRIYFESEGKVLCDNRPKAVELTLDEIAEKFGIPVNLLRIKK